MRYREPRRHPAQALAWVLLAALMLSAPQLVVAVLSGVLSAVVWLLATSGGSAVLVVALAVTLGWLAVDRLRGLRFRAPLYGRGWTW